MSLIQLWGSKMIKYEKSLYGGRPKNPVADCRFHRCCLTLNEIKKHECLRKQCLYLTRREHPCWEQREQQKQIKKNKRAEFKARIGR